MFLTVVFISASILWTLKEFKIFHASKFSKLGIKARNPASVAKTKGDSFQSGKNIKKQIKHQVYTWFFYRQHLEM